MSLVVEKKKNSDLTLVAKVRDTKSKSSNKFSEYIYFDPDGNSVEELTKENLIPVPYIDIENNQRAAIYVAAPSGSGKSTLASGLIKSIRELRKDKTRKVVVFTSNPIPDPAFEPIENLVVFPFDNPGFEVITPDMIQDNIIIFDDWENISDKKLFKQVIYFIKMILEQTRKVGVDVIVISHQIKQGLITKPIIYECTDYYLSFASNKNACIKFLESYLDLPKKTLKELNAKKYKPYTFCLFRKSFPMYSIVNGTIKLL